MTRWSAGTTRQTAYGMTAPARLSAPLRRALLSQEALVEAFSDFASRGLIPDLRSNAYGLGVARVSALAKDAGITQALLSPIDIEGSVVAPASHDVPSSSSWLEGSRPVVTLEGDVVSLKRVPAGTPVSYGYQYRTASETTLALVSVGFADGVPRSASTKGEVSLGGNRHRVAGRIAMDQMVLDIGDAPAELGDVVTIWGQDPSVTEWSEWCSRPVALLVAQLASRVVKIWN